MQDIIEFVIFISIFCVIAGINMIYSNEFLEYMKTHYPSKYKRLTLKSFMGIPGEYVPLNVNPINFIQSIFSIEKQDDEKVLHHKRRVKVSLLLTLGLLIAWYFYA